MSLHWGALAASAIQTSCDNRGSVRQTSHIIFSSQMIFLVATLANLSAAETVNNCCMIAVYLCVFQWAIPLQCLGLTVHLRNRWIITTVYTWRLCLNFSTDIKPAVDLPTHTSCASSKNVGKLIKTAVCGPDKRRGNVHIFVLMSCECINFLVLQNDAQSTEWSKWMNPIWGLYMCLKITHKNTLVIQVKRNCSPLSQLFRRSPCWSAKKIHPC